MQLIIQDGWMWLCITLVIMLITLLIMNIQGRSFYTKDVVIRKFSIMDLELPASAQELVNIVKGIFLLPVAQSKKAVNALKGQLYVDFIFMAAAYISIFILCSIVSGKMTYLGHSVFMVLAWLQLIAWLCDIIENIYLLKKLTPAIVASKPAVHKAYQILEILKWGIAMTGTVCSVSGLIYFWIVGHYMYSSLFFLVIIISELILFIIANKIFERKETISS